MKHKNEPANLRDLLETRVAAQPDKVFLYSETDGRRFTYAQFAAAVNRAANMLAAHGVAKGDVVSLLMPNSPEYVVAYFACWKLGALAGPVNSLLKAEELAYVIGHSEAKVLLAGADFLPAVDTIRAELLHLQHVIAFDDEAQATIGYEITPNPQPPTPNPQSEDDAIIIYTSGTTGKPKGCLLTHGNILANARQITEWMGFGENDRLLTVMPLFHMNAVSVTTLTSLYAGASTVVSAKFSATRHWQIVSDYGVTSFGSVATMLSMLLAKYPEGVPTGLQIEQLRFAMCGSAPVPAEVIRRFESTFNCLVIEGYGLSESTCRSTFNPPNTERRPGSCGKPIGNEMRVVNELDEDAPDGELGEIVLRGENILKGYFKNEAATAQAFRNGWFHTNDIGYRDADGFYYIVDRKSDMIIRAGENIYPREIDEVLYQHTALAAAATIGVPDELYGEEVAAFVILKDGATVTESDILEHCRAHLADFKCPKTVHFVADIPKGPTGKLLKRELTRIFSSMFQAQTSRP